MTTCVLTAFGGSAAALAQRAGKSDRRPGGQRVLSAQTASSLPATPSLRSALGLPLASLARGRSPPARPRAASSLPADTPSTMPPYPIGTPGVPWGDAERLAWRARVEPAVTRSYRDEVVAKIDALRDRFDVVRYGALPYDAADPDRYPLFAVKTRNWSAAKPCVLVTGGVHGYETSGVQGALRFLETECANVQDTFNVLVAPCVSPWGYERVQRWNQKCLTHTYNLTFLTHPCGNSAAAINWPKTSHRIKTAR